MLVAPSILATPLDERSVTFTADGRTVYFPIRLGDGYLQVLCTSTIIHNHWSEPKVLPFSGGPAFDADPFITADGHILYFASTRTLNGKAKPDFDIWVVERHGNAWSAPRPLSGLVNTPANERAPYLAASGRLYFATNKNGHNQLFYADPSGSGFGAPVALPDTINNDGENVSIAVNPAETLLVFASIGRADELLAPGQGYPRGDLYLSHKLASGWSPAEHLGQPINSAAAELSPSFSKDGRWLYFMSERGFATNQTITLTYDALNRGLATALNGRGNLYRVDARALLSSSEFQP